MKTRKLSTIDGFVLIDLEDAPGSVGVVRSAPKILVSGAEMLARSVTYSLATFGIRASGASAGVNAKPADRSAAVAAFAEELAGFDPPVLIDPGKGVDPADLAALVARDPRSVELREVRDGVSGSDTLLAAGAIAAATAVVGSLQGKRIAIEGFGPAGLALARQATESGAGVVAVATAAGTALQADGFDVAALAEGWATQEDALATSMGSAQKPGWAVWGADADVVFCGSKAGAMTHEGAANVKASAVVPIGPVPITAKAFAVLNRASVTYVPDFVSTAAPLLAGVGTIDPLECPNRIAAVIQEAIGGERGLFLTCCERAEAFLRSWQDALPFGRPLA